MRDAPSPGYRETSALSLTPASKRELRGWSGLAVAALALAGVLALLLALSRTPKIQDFLPWPVQEFFYRALVTHVVFSFVVWFLGVLGALMVLTTARLAMGQTRARRLGTVGLGAGALGCLILLAPALLNWGEPSLNNYVPVVIHPVFYAGLVLLALGVGMVAVRLILNLPGREVGPVDWGIAAAAAAYLVALVCFGLALIAIPSGTGEALFNERLFWGGGHVLQFVNTALMLVGWSVLAEITLGEMPLGPWLSAAVAGSLVLFVLPAPVFYALFDVLSREHRDAFTQMLWYGLAPQPVVMMAGLARLLYQRRTALPWRDPAFVGLVLSVGLFAVGGLFGFFLGVADTRTPSHYHAVIGGVNLAAMALYFALLLPLLGRSSRRAGPIRWQFHLYGFGQLLFSVGMFLAGEAGVPRKTAGAEQGLDTIGKVVSMAMTGTGGIIAVMGGVMFVWMALSRLMARR
ncbi:MAG: cbb3-type cytochrome c oxidase subunit I [Alphaproteobacteria bacterium]|nr:cbb3-type cytochrome c oxidase subunit I [Alphaproteobacteria bacterium]